MGVIIDEQTPAALARWLVAKGHTAQHVADLKMQSVPDTVIWDYAVKIGAVIVTKDEDFAQRQLLGKNGPPIIWIRLPNTRRQALLNWFDGILPEIVLALDRGEVLIEVT